MAVVIEDAYGDTASVTITGPSPRIEALLAAAAELNAALRP